MPEEKDETKSADAEVDIAQETPSGLDIPILESSINSPESISPQELEPDEGPEEEPEDDGFEIRPKRPRKKGGKKVVRTVREEYLADEDGQNGEDDTSDFDSLSLGGYYSVDRISPAYINGTPSAGMIEKFGIETPIDEIIEALRTTYGGGTFKIRKHSEKGKWIGSKQFKVPGRPKLPDDNSNERAIPKDAQDPNDELKTMQVDIKKTELGTIKAQKEYEARKKLRMLEEQDEFKSSDSGDSDLKLEIERLRLKMEYDAKLNELRNELKEFGNTKPDNTGAIIAAITAAVGVTLKSLIDASATSAKSKEDSNSTMMSLMMEMSKIQQASQAAIITATSQAAGNSIELLKGMLAEKSTAKRDEINQTIEILRLGTELGQGNSKDEEGNFNTGSQVVDTVLGGIRAVTKKISEAREPLGELPAPQLASSGRPIISRQVPQAPPPPPAPPQPTAAQLAEEQKKGLMKQILKSLAVEAEVCPTESQWARGIVKHLPIDIREAFSKCSTVEDVLKLVNPYLDASLIMDFAPIIQNEVKKKWLMGAVEELKENIKAVKRTPKAKPEVKSETLAAMEEQKAQESF